MTPIIFLVYRLNISNFLRSGEGPAIAQILLLWEMLVVFVLALLRRDSIFTRVFAWIIFSCYVTDLTLGNIEQRVALCSVKWIDLRESIIAVISYFLI